MSKPVVAREASMLIFAQYDPDEDCIFLRMPNGICMLDEHMAPEKLYRMLLQHIARNGVDLPSQEAEK